MMNSREILENINSIYDRFELPPNLREHQARSAALAYEWSKRWTGPDVDFLNVMAVAAVHDLGNICKMNFDEGGLNFLPTGERSRLAYWRGVKKKVLQKYGADSYTVTQNMLNELGMDEWLHYMLQHKEFRHAPTVLRSKRWDVKLCFCNDLRIGPLGLLAMEERFSEVERRKEVRPDQITRLPNYVELKEQALKIDTLVRSHIQNEPEISHELVESDMRKILKDPAFLLD